jgi:hypothetical protein
MFSGILMLPNSPYGIVVAEYHNNQGYAKFEILSNYFVCQLLYIVKTASIINKS